MPLAPPRWTQEEIARDVAASAAVFRRVRFAEPREKWLEEVDRRIAEFETLFAKYGVAKPENLTGADLPNVVKDDLLSALRYLPGPPISADDLRALADVGSLSATALRKDPDAAEAVLDVIRQSLDPRRFPWLAANREPTHEEQQISILASAMLHAAQRIQTMRRNTAKSEQEAAVRAELARVGLHGAVLAEIPPGGYTKFPDRGVYSVNEVMFGPAKADVLARAWDDRMVPIECKVSNSTVNSYKRVIHDTIAKIPVWTRSFGADTVVSTAVLAGVYSTPNLVSAQERGLTIFWAHRISDLGDFMEGTKAK